MTNLTSLEKIVLLAFSTYATAEGTKSDLGVSWTDAAMLATATSLKLNTVKGVLGSLVKKGLVYSDHEPGKPDALCLTEAGVDAHFQIDADGSVFMDDAPVTETPVDMGAAMTADEDAAVAQAQHEDGQAALISEMEEELALTAFLKAGADEAQAKAMGIPMPGIICSTLRQFAGGWTGTRKTFIKTAELAGFNTKTAATQWQRERKGL